MCTSTNAFMINVGETGRKLPPTIFINIFNFWRKETKMHQNQLKLGAISVKTCQQTITAFIKINIIYLVHKLYIETSEETILVWNANILYFLIFLF